MITFPSCDFVSPLVSKIIRNGLIISPDKIYSLMLIYNKR